jgi:putative flippase GtrA
MPAVECRPQATALMIQLVRYTIIGVPAFAVDFGLLFFLTHFVHIPYLLSAAIAFIAGVSISYYLSVLWVFSSRSMDSKSAEFLIFVIVGIVGLGLNELIIWFFTEQIHFHYLVSKINSTLLVYFWNFFARKCLLFR